MSASSKPTRKPRSRRPSARLSAVVDFPTPPLPEATAMTAAIPGISDCFDIGDAGLCGGRCEETCGTPCALRGGGGAAEPGLRSAVSAIIPALGGRRSALLPGGLVIQFDHDAIRVIDEYLPEISTRNLSRVELHPFGGQPLLHAGKIAAGEGDMVDNAGIRLLRLVGAGNIHQMHDRLAIAVHPRPRKGKVRPRALLQSQHVLVEPDRVGELAGPNVEMVEHAYAHAITPFVLKY